MSLLLTAAGCGTGGQGSAGSRAAALARACPGAVGRGGAALSRCPYTRVSFIGRRGEGVLRCPEALAFAPDGDLYVADQFSHLVQRFSPAGRFLGQWGSYGSGPGQLGAVDGLAVDARGEVYVLDCTHDRVERFSPAGRLLGEWGSPGRGARAVRLRARLRAGQAARRRDRGRRGGYVYVADSANNRIAALRPRRLAMQCSGGRPGQRAGAVLEPPRAGRSRGAWCMSPTRATIACRRSTCGAARWTRRALSAKGRASSSTRSASPSTAARVYVVDDNNNRIAVLTRGLRPLGEWGGARTPYALSYIRAAAVNPAGRCVRRRYRARTDSGLRRRRARAAGVRHARDDPGQLIAPLTVAAGPRGRVVVAETYGSRSPVYLFDSCAAAARAAGCVRVAANGAAARSSAATGLGPPRRRSRPAARCGSPTRATTSSATSPPRRVPRRGREGRAAADRRGGPPPGLAVRAAANRRRRRALGRLYVADTGRGRIARFAADGRPLGTLGAGLLERPLAVALAPGGELYVADSGRDRVVELSPAGATLAAWGGPGTRPGVSWNRPGSRWTRPGRCSSPTAAGPHPGVRARGRPARRVGHPRRRGRGGSACRAASRPTAAGTCSSRTPRTTASRSSPGPRRAAPHACAGAGCGVGTRAAP